MSLDPKRTVAELKELRRFTADENGAQRVAFTKTWVATRAWLKKKLEALPVEMHTDAAGNLWTALRGKSERELLIGGHMDSVLAGAATVVGRADCHSEEKLRMAGFARTAR